MKNFYQTINYSSSNEDSNSEILSLAIKKTDSVLCISGSGARCLDLLITKPARIVSIDFNPCQNFLLELKIAAIKQLDYTSFVRFLGLEDSIQRIETYKILKENLSRAARDFWDNNLKIIEKGMIYQGRWEKYFRLLAFIVRVTRPKVLSRLFEDISIKQQGKIWREDWNDVLWQKFLQIIGAKVFWKFLLKDPGFYKYVPEDFNVPHYLIEQFNQAIHCFHFNKSAFLSLLFWGRFIESADLPAYLQAKNFETLKNNTQRIEIVTSCLNDYLLKCKANSFDAYSLSDFSSYTSEQEYFDIWNSIILKARPAARICERQFLVKRNIPAKLKNKVSRNTGLEQKLATRDASVFYTFLIGQVRKS